MPRHLVHTLLVLFLVGLLQRKEHQCHTALVAVWHGAISVWHCMTWGYFQLYDIGLFLLLVAERAQCHTALFTWHVSRCSFSSRVSLDDRAQCYYRSGLGCVLPRHLCHAGLHVFKSIFFILGTSTCIWMLFVNVGSEEQKARGVSQFMRGASTSAHELRPCSRTCAWRCNTHTHTLSTLPPPLSPSLPLSLSPSFPLSRSLSLHLPPSPSFPLSLSPSLPLSLSPTLWLGPAWAAGNIIIASTSRRRGPILALRHSNQSWVNFPGEFGCESRVFARCTGSCVCLMRVLVMTPWVRDEFGCELRGFARCTGSCMGVSVTTHWVRGGLHDAQVRACYDECVDDVFMTHWILDKLGY